MSCGTLVSARFFRFSRTWLLHSLTALSNAIPLTSASLLPVLNPGKHALRFGLFPFRSPLLRKSLFIFSSSGYLDVSVPRVPACRAIHSPCGSRASLGWVSPFGYLRIYVCLRLPAAFRSWPRPSSAFGALASTLCSSSLDYFLRPTSFRLLFLYLL